THTGLTFGRGGDGLGVGHGESDWSHSAVVGGGGQNWGEVAFPYHLTTAVRLLHTHTHTHTHTHAHTHTHPHARTHEHTHTHTHTHARPGLMRCPVCLAP